MRVWPGQQIRQRTGRNVGPGTEVTALVLDTASERGEGASRLAAWTAYPHGPGPVSQRAPRHPMTSKTLHEIAAALVAPGKGILAADESFPTIAKRFESVGVATSEEQRRRYRQLFFTAPKVGDYVSGVICFDETLRQKDDAGVPFPASLKAAGVIAGIKVDTGAKPLAGCDGETVTEGLDGLRARLGEYHELGARFAKWRAVIEVDAAGPRPTRSCIEANAHALARYAALCQEQGLVPIVEPEVLMDGDHDAARCEAVTREVLTAVFAQLAVQRVDLRGILLKPNMIVAGKKCARQADVQEVAARTLSTLQDCVPASVPGIVFLSGGQSDELATVHLDAINRIDSTRPWAVSFSYGRALQASALVAWSGKEENVAAAQSAFLRRARCNSAAARGQYDAAMEK